MLIPFADQNSFLAVEKVKGNQIRDLGYDYKHRTDVYLIVTACPLRADV